MKASGAAGVGSSSSARPGATAASVRRRNGAGRVDASSSFRASGADDDHAGATSDRRRGGTAAERGWVWRLLAPDASSPHLMGQWLFLQGLAAVYLVAFASLYVQIPGLWGHEGILPADAFVRRIDTTKMASVLWYLTPHMTVDTALHATALAGVVLSASVLLLQFNSSVLFAALYLLYLSLFQVGQTFLSFQWDILLLETGFLAIFVAPLFSRSKYDLASSASPLSTFMVRWLLFRLMFLSGIVKLSSQCPTWWGLTALHYHYETQCIPGPLAWYAHHLPDAVQRFSVAATFVIEILCPFWIFVPNRLVQIAAGLLQILLQLLIILTGNYNFFNWLTIVLCFPLFDDRFHAGLLVLPANVKRALAGGERRRPWRSLAGALSWVLLALVVAGTAAVCWHAFAVDWPRLVDGSAPNLNNPHPAIRIAFTRDQWAAFLHVATPMGVVAGAFFFVINALRHVGQAVFAALSTAPASDDNRGANDQQRRGVSERKPKTTVMKLQRQQRSLISTVVGLWRVGYAVALVALLWGLFLASLVPFAKSADKATLHELPQIAHTCYALTQPWLATHSYGLFARMTTERPEIRVEGSQDGRTWKPYLFKYKADLPNVAPPIVAPHQPRLDWQMWFAALGSYQQAPWFVSFLARLMDNSRPVIDLLANDPFPLAPPAYVRGVVQGYHFSKPANGSLVTELLIGADRVLFGRKQILSSSLSGGATGEGKWWDVGRSAKEYLTLTPDTAGQLERYFGNYGWQLHVDPQVYSRETEWERILTEDVFRLVSPYAAVFVATCIGLALLPTSAFWPLFFR